MPQPSIIIIIINASVRKLTNGRAGHAAGSMQSRAGQQVACAQGQLVARSGLGQLVACAQGQGMLLVARSVAEQQVACARGQGSRAHYY